MPTDSYAVARTADGSPQVIVRRSTRRTRSVSAFRENGAIVVAIPASMSRADEQRWVRTMVDRLAAAERKTDLGDAELVERARVLARRYVPGAPEPASITWSTRQGKRWGSCTMPDRTIRIAERVRPMPAYVRDYVIIHELTHMLHRGHGREFRAVVDAFADTARAEAFLAGVAYADRLAGREGPASD